MSDSSLTPSVTPAMIEAAARDFVAVANEHNSGPELAAAFDALRAALSAAPSPTPELTEDEIMAMPFAPRDANEPEHTQLSRYLAGLSWVTDNPDSQEVPLPLEKLHALIAEYAELRDRPSVPRPRTEGTPHVLDEVVDRIEARMIEAQNFMREPCTPGDRASARSMMVVGLSEIVELRAALSHAEAGAGRPDDPANVNVDEQLSVQNLEFAEDATTVILPVKRVELHEGKMLAFMDATELEGALQGRQTLVPSSARSPVAPEPTPEVDREALVPRIVRILDVRNTPPVPPGPLPIGPREGYESFLRETAYRILDVALGLEGGSTYVPPVPAPAQENHNG